MMSLRRSAVAGLAAAFFVAACAGRHPEDARPGGPQASLARPLEIYAQMGLLAGPPQFPVVASFSSLAGPADSTWVLLSLSLPNSALRFQRDTTGFVAEYTVSAVFVRDSAEVARLDAREQVRIATFAESGRTDESVVFQQLVALAPGPYEVRLAADDAGSSRGFRAADTLAVPAYHAGAARLATPLVVYRAEGRRARAERPSLIANPRHAAPYGGEPPRLYLEGYGLDSAGVVQVRVLNDAGADAWHADVPLSRGDSTLRHAVIELPVGALPLGRFSIEVAATGAPAVRTPLVLTISDQWMVANFEELLRFLRYIAHGDELDSLRTGTAAERRARWESFWERRDPLPVTELNEFREEFFQRVRYATEAFREPGARAGWETDRGEVYIVLGPPEQALERWLGVSDRAGEPNAQEWYYSAAPGGRLTLLFLDRTGFGRFELTPSSESAFRSAAERLKPRH